MSPSVPKSRKWILIVPSVFAFILLLIAAYILFWPQSIEDHIRKSVTEALADRFKADVDLKALHIRLFANPNVIGEGLSLRRHGRSDVPPLIQIEKFSFKVGFMGLLGPVKHIALLRVQNMLITIPPRESSPTPLPPHSSPSAILCPELL